MKKLFSFAVFAIISMAAAMLVSCSKDGLPKVNITIKTEQPVIDGVVYVVVGQKLKITDIEVTNLEDGKAAMLNNVTFFWNRIPCGGKQLAPFTHEYEATTKDDLGKQEISIICRVLAVGKTLAVAEVIKDVKVVESEDDIPTPTKSGYEINVTTQLVAE